VAGGAGRRSAAGHAANAAKGSVVRQSKIAPPMTGSGQNLPWGHIGLNVRIPRKQPSENRYSITSPALGPSRAPAPSASAE